jgi:hypothetical protein
MNRDALWSSSQRRSPKLSVNLRINVKREDKTDSDDHLTTNVLELWKVSDVYSIYLVPYVVGVDLSEWMSKKVMNRLFVGLAYPDIASSVDLESVLSQL